MQKVHEPTKKTKTIMYDIKRECGQQAWGKSLRRLNHTARSVPSLFEGVAQNKAQTSSPKGGREGKILQE